MKIAVTGATGFIGRHVIADLKHRGVDVTACGRHDSNPRSLNVANVRWVTLDLAQSRDDFFDRLGRPDVLIHLAWGGLPNYGSLRHFEVELPHQYGFLSSIIRSGLPAIVAAGTCFEYGHQSGALSANLETRPTNPYGFAKDVLRKELEYLRAVHPYKLTWARLFYIYGDDQPNTTLLAKLRAAAAAGHKEFPMSGGEQLRDYLPVSEVARRIVDLAIDPEDLGPINICSGRPISIRRLVDGWINEHAWKIEPRYGELPYPDYEPLAFWGIP